MEFAYDGGGLAKGGDVTLYLDGDKVGEGRVEHTVRWSSPATRRPTWVATALRPSATTTGTDNGFTGRVRWVQIDLDEAAEDADHLITPEELPRVAMARQ